MVKLNLLVAGIGGQGIITLGKIIANAVIDAGKKCLVAETHGLAQRGGAVNIHIRIGEVMSPLIPLRGADYLIALEATEALRNLNYASKDKTLLILNKLIVRPVLPKVKLVELEDIDKRLSEFKRIWVDSQSITESVGNPKGVNIAILGFIVGLGIFENICNEENFLKFISGELNRRTFLKAIKYAHSYVLRRPL